MDIVLIVVVILGFALIISIGLEVVAVWLKKRADRKKHWRAFLVSNIEVVDPEIVVPHE